MILKKTVHIFPDEQNSKAILSHLLKGYLSHLVFIKMLTTCNSTFLEQGGCLEPLDRGTASRGSCNAWLLPQEASHGVASRTSAPQGAQVCQVMLTHLGFGKDNL